MSNSFQFDEREFKHFIESEAQAAINDRAAQRTQELEAFRQQHSGRPLEEIKPALKRLFENDGGSITEPELSDWAQLISEGIRIEMKPEAIDWTGAL